MKLPEKKKEVDFASSSAAHRSRMAHPLLTNIWFWNSFIEFSAGLVALINPDTLFTGAAKSPATARQSARWWSAAVFALAALSWPMRHVSDDNELKQLAAAALLLYHIFLAIFHVPWRLIGIRDPIPLEKKLFGGAIHITLSALFVMYLNKHNFWAKAAHLYRL